MRIIGLSENVFLVTSALGFLLGIALATYIFRPQKANFFLGLIVLIMSLELLFSWGSYSGYNNTTTAFPFWIFLSYYPLPPAVWLATKCTFDPTFKLRGWHGLLFVPAWVEILIHSFFKLGIVPYPVNLMEHQVWRWFIEYIPLIGMISALGFFWLKYAEASRLNRFRRAESIRIPHAKLLLFMSTLSLLCLLWLAFVFIGWEYFSVIELMLVLLLFAFSFLSLLDNPSFLLVEKTNGETRFAHYDDQSQIKRIERVMLEKQLFTRPTLSLKELSQELNLPSRYISYLINRYHRKNFKGFINDFRVEAFIAKAKSPEEQHKTLLAIALESGFNSKATFNQVFRNCKGKSPSNYLS